MISIPQIRAGRALLNWSQRQLAEAAGISQRNVHNIEAGLVVPRLPTIKAIQVALEKANIVFANNNTVSLQDEVFEVDRWEGTGSLEALVNELITNCRLGATEVLLCNTDERRFIENSTLEMKTRYFNALERLGVKERCLIVHGDTVLFGKPESYRWMPKEYFGEVSYIICGALLAIIVWQPFLRIVRIQNVAVTESFRRHFEGLWNVSTIPPFIEQQADQRMKANG